MNKKQPPETNARAYLEAGASWESDQLATVKRSEKRAWTVAIVATVIAALAVLAIALLTPLKKVEPFIVQVDKIGAASTVSLLDTKTIAASEALDKYWLDQYVNFREEYNKATSYGNFVSTRLMSNAAVGSTFFEQVNPQNPKSPTAVYGAKGNVEISVTNISFIAKGHAQVRFTRTEKSGPDDASSVTRWIATIAYRYTNPPMKENERLINPVGFQVTDYRKDPETVGGVN